MTKRQEKRRPTQVVGPRLKILFTGLLIVFSLLAINAFYLGSITFFEWKYLQTYQDYFYQIMFLLHLVLGLIFVIPFILFGVIHFKNAWRRKNRRAVYVGIALLLTMLLLLISGLLLVRFDFFEVRDPIIRNLGYWTHVITPLVCVWLFVLHRLAGPRIHWKAGGVIASVAGVFALLGVYMQTQDPRQWNSVGPDSGEKYFFPSLARTASGNFIPAKALMQDQYCRDCHQNIHKQWTGSAHKMSSFNNPAYLFSVRNTRKVALERDGDVQAARFCAGCHDPVPFFSGAFDDPDFDDVNHPTSQAGITCTSCHAITHVNSRKGNSDFTIEEPAHYPFVYSDNEILQWINRQLVKAKPEMHKKTFLKPLHQSPEFCSTCHKVHLPKELNHYKWLRGQNHYDSYHLSGVSGHGVSSFYYPPKPQHNCNTCHMPLLASDDFGADYRDDSGVLKVHDHMFPSANTALPHLKGLPDWVNENHRQFMDGVMLLDIFGLRENGEIDGKLIAPLESKQVSLLPGKTYLIEVVVRTMKMGHIFTQGTADSNEIWLEIIASTGERIIGRSGGIKSNDKSVDPWSHFVNAYLLDRDGNRIDRRNAEDIFVPLYNHQIPPGAADVIHYRLTVPEDVEGTVKISAKLNYRKFDTTYMRHFSGDSFIRNDLPVLELASDSIELPTMTGGKLKKKIGDIRPLWMRWNDYGIGLIRKPQKSQLRQAEEAFQRVDELGSAFGSLNKARVYYLEGRLNEAVMELQRSSTFETSAWPWTIAWYTGLVNKQNGFLDEAIDNFERILANDYELARERDFDFSQDYRVWNELGQTLIERAKRERGGKRRKARDEFLKKGEQAFLTTLTFDEENATAHFNLAQIYQMLEMNEKSKKHHQLHEKYRVDDNARDFAINQHRRNNPAADHAADAVVIYDLNKTTEYQERINTLQPVNK
ncbi:multiheme c-type cytochrome [Aliikangiella sp. G2MR2-5]|uniref:multiheme c-type cytochrome n=1 Tax=Aliikangiella sp. G2MR2-5 TaxID=2788943 RepID=UPI0018AC6CD8|nr:multiheme c-type cytochrome [Aliikangiella sp. G2MR2-5]